MKMLKGSLLVCVQSYKSQMSWFWSVLLGVMSLSYLTVGLFQADVKIILSFSIPLYIFMWIIGSKFLTRTFNYYLRFGMSRSRYMSMVGLLFLLISVFNAVLSNVFHELFDVLIGNRQNIQIFVMHPLNIFDSTFPFLFIVILDIFISLFCLVSGLLTNYIFYRFGIAGGYSLTGLFILAVIMVVLLEWYGKLYEWIVHTSLFVFCGVIFIISALMYTILAIFVSKLSVVQA